MSVEVVKWSRIQLGGKVQVAFTLPPAMVGRSIGAPRTLRVVQGLGVWVVEDAEWLALVLEVKRHQHALFAFERDAALGRVVVAYEKNLDASRKCDKCQRFSISQCPQHNHRFRYEPARDEPPPPRNPGPAFQDFEEFVSAMHGFGGAPSFDRVRRAARSNKPFVDFVEEEVHRIRQAERVQEAQKAAPPAVVRGQLPTGADYAALGLAAGCSKEDVKRAHRRLAVEHHPDRGGSTAKLAAINVARDRILFALGLGVS
jgi:hypothetical protein